MNTHEELNELFGEDGEPDYIKCDWELSRSDYGDFWDSIDDDIDYGDRIEDNFWNSYFDWVPYAYLRKCANCGDFYWSDYVDSKPVCDKKECCDELEKRKTNEQLRELETALLHVSQTSVEHIASKKHKPFIKENETEPVKIVEEIKVGNPNVAKLKFNDLHDGYVYLMKSGNLYKIGITNNIDRRLKTIEAQSALPVTCVHSFKSKNNRKAESRLHKKYAKYNSHYEWFNLPEDAVEAIKSIQDYQMG